MKKKQDTQTVIINLVGEYRNLFPQEYEAVVKIVAEKKNLSINDGDFTKQSDFIERALLEYPETLWAIFQSRLSPEDALYINSKPGARWFGKRFPEFCLVKNV